jgi:hypothetical protein
MAQVSTRPEKRPLPYRRSVLVGRHQNADDAMIKHAVRRHFDDIDDDLVTNYFDNLIQLPIRVPALGTQEVRAHRMLLFIDKSGLDQPTREGVRAQRDMAGQAGLSRVSANSARHIFRRADRSVRYCRSPGAAHGYGVRGCGKSQTGQALSQRARHPGVYPQGTRRWRRRSGPGEHSPVRRLGNPKAYAALTKAVAENNQGKPAFLAAWRTRPMLVRN